MQQGSQKTGIRWAIGALIVVATVAALIAVVKLDPTGRTGSGLSKDFLYDLNELAKIDPNLILYAASSPPLKTGFRRSRGIALDGAGRIYVAGDRGIRVFSAAGELEQAINASGEPQCLTVSDDGTIYVGLRDRVEVLGPQGQHIALWEALGDEAFLTSIERYEDTIFVADAGHRIVLCYDTAGTLLDHIGEKDPDRNIPGFMIPSPHFDLAVSRDGMLRVVSPGRHRIETYTLDGDFEFWWGEPSTSIEGFCGCCNPINFAILPNGWFITSEKGLERVKVYDSDGAFVGVVAGVAQLTQGKLVKICETPEECQEGGMDVAAGADGRVYVLETTENTVRVFSRKDTKQ